MIIDALKSSKVNVSKAAEELGTSRHSLRMRLEKFNLDYRKYRTSNLSEEPQR